jgi:hypothetical protein
VTDEELSSALSTIRAAARAEGHKPEISNNVETMILFALRYAEKVPESAVEVRAAVELIRQWEGEAHRPKWMQ